jgi:hypothetical protein
VGVEEEGEYSSTMSVGSVLSREMRTSGEEEEEEEEGGGEEEGALAAVCCVASLF